ncbi:MAG: hypothetical protein AB7N24_20730 [Dehalococcoidia bacterium]
MPIPSQSKTVTIAGVEVVAEAVMNNCSNLWTATAKSPQKLLATAAGSSPETALANAIAIAEDALAVR